MTLLEDVRQTVQHGFNDFKTFIQNALDKDEKLLSKTYITPDGQQKTLLNYLIELDCDKNDLSNFISFLLELGADPNLQAPFHFVLESNKPHLIPIFFKEARLLNINARDMEGKTLVYRIIEAGEVKLLLDLIPHEINLYQPTRVLVHNEVLELQPLHQAIISNLPEVVRELLKCGVLSAALFGRLQETPALLAARLGHVDILDILLRHGLQDNNELKNLPSNERNAKNQCAIELMASLIKDKTKKAEAVRGVALLLCHGYEVPDDLELRQLIIKNRDLLWQHVSHYCSQYPELLSVFTRRCKNKNDPLYEIIFTKPSGFWNFFGPSNKLPFEISNKITELDVGFEDHEKKFAKFVQNYSYSLEHSIFPKMWDSTYGKISQGEIHNMRSLEHHLKTSKENQAKAVFMEMEGPRSSIHSGFNHG